MEANLNDQNYLPSLFERVKALRFSAGLRNYDSVITDITVIQSEFVVYGDAMGVIFCHKAIAQVYLGRLADLKETDERIASLEMALYHINEAMILAVKGGSVQPSLIKCQSVVKSRLGDLLHREGRHAEANFLETDGLKALNKMLERHPDYAEGYLENAAASFLKVQWTLHKVSADLKKAAGLLRRPRHTKHLPTATEVSQFMHRITVLQAAVQGMLSAAQFD